MAYELMEMSTGNLVSVQADQESALRIVAAAIDRGGPQAIDTLALAYDDPTGQTDGYIVAEGAELVELARQFRQASSTTPVHA